MTNPSKDSAPFAVGIFNMPQICLYTAATIRRLFLAYSKVVRMVALENRIDVDKCYISRAAIISVFREAKKDCEIFQERRPLGHGLSAGKVVGSLVFRLCRTQTVFLHRNIIESRDALQISVTSSLALGLRLMGIDYGSVDEFIVRELKYFLAKRHINQEALGICFDALAQSGCGRQREQN